MNFTNRWPLSHIIFKPRWSLSSSFPYLVSTLSRLLCFCDVRHRGSSESKRFSDVLVVKPLLCFTFRNLLSLPNRRPRKKASRPFTRLLAPHLHQQQKKKRWPSCRLRCAPLAPPTKVRCVRISGALCGGVTRKDPTAAQLECVWINGNFRVAACLPLCRCCCLSSTMLTVVARMNSFLSEQ